MNKYGAKKTEYNGRLYDSKKEAQYASILDLSKRAIAPTCRVVSWEPQVRFDIVINDKKICSYYLDFLVKYADGHIEHIDVKGGRATKTAVYRLKKKLVEAVHNIKIKEV